MYHTGKKGELMFKDINKLNGVWSEKRGVNDGKNEENRKISKTKRILGYRFHH